MSDLQLEFRYSGGVDNNNPDSSIGGEMSNFPVNLVKSENLWDYISEASKQIGATDGENPGTKDYRVIYLRVAPGSVGTGENGRLWMSANDSISAISFRLAIGSLNELIPHLPTENFPPDLTFADAPEAQEDGIALPDVVAGDFLGVVIERSIGITKDLQTNKGPTFSIYWD